MYFQSDTAILSDETCNLGHWNLHQGELEFRGNKAYFNGRKVVIAHFSGLPDKEQLDLVSAHSYLYTRDRSKPWATMAMNYLSRLDKATASLPSIAYSYSDIQPGYRRKEEKHTTAASKGLRKRFPSKVMRKVARSLKSPGKIVGGMKLASWQIKQKFQIAQNILTDKGKTEIFQDRSTNAFTGLVPCIGNYETYLIRTSILQAVVGAKNHFHGKLLDVGAGSAPYEGIIVANGKVTQYIKLDLASSAYHKGDNIDLTWDGKIIPLDSQSIDTVFMTEVLEHFHKPAELLQEVRRVLKPRGILFLTVPFTWPMHELPYDYHRFTPIALRAYLEEASFEVEKIEILGGWDHSLAQHLGLWLTNRSMDERLRKLAKLIAWPFYSYLSRVGKDEYKAVRNHQMYHGLAGIAVAV